MATAENPAAFGALLRHYRIAAALTQEGLAERAGLGLRTIQRLEHGERRAHRETAQRLAAALCLPEDDRSRFASAARPAPRRRASSSESKAPRGQNLTPRDGRRRRHNLPAQLTSFVGREREITAIRRLLIGAGVPARSRPRPEPRLVTLTGPPGAGKTRLACEAAFSLIDNLDDGVTFVRLAPIRDPTLVIAAIAQTVDVRETGGRPILERLKDFLENKRLLLVLDNFEQILGAATAVAELLAVCPGLKVLATSRERLNLRGEHELVVSPLAVPERQDLLPAVHLARGDAICLFLDRARSVKADLVITASDVPAVVEICRRLDGLPLAIELAAAHIRVLAPSELLARLKHRLALLTQGPRDLPERQRTLRAAIDWSYDLLDADKQALFRRVAIFVGGFTLEAAEAVCGFDLPDTLAGLESLVSKSLLRLEDQLDGELRFGLLETLRDYGLERLVASGELDGLRDRHGRYFLALSELENAHFFGRTSPEAVWYDRVERERDNLRAALDWLRARRDPVQSLRLVAALWRFWFVRGPLSEGREQIVGVLALSEESAPTAARVEALWALGSIAFVQGDYTAAASFYEECLATARTVGEPREIAWALLRLGNLRVHLGHSAVGNSLLAESLPFIEAAGDQRLVSASCHFMGEAAILRGDYAAARSLLERAVSVARYLDDAWRTAHALYSLGHAALELGSLTEARASFAEALVISRDIGDTWEMAVDLDGFAILAMAEGQPARAVRLAAASDTQLAAIGGSRPPPWTERIEHRLQLARRELDPEIATAVQAEGRSMTLEQATTYALEDGGA